ncbi:MAG: serine/threonine-protein kinase [Terriglobales bacterium]
MALRRGAKLKTTFDTYTVQEQLGCGGAGTVYNAADSDENIHAIKVLNRERATTTALKRFQNEIHFCSNTVHTNIVRVTDRGLTEADEPFYVMPRYSDSLRQLMRSGIQPGNVLPLFGQMLDGTEAAHLRGVWHRDLKPENILHDRANGILVIADFGIARFEEEELLTAVETRNDERLANFVYAAPEQRVRNREVSAAADVYALGLILNEMFTGEVPQGAGYRRIAALAPQFSYVDGIVEQMIQQDAAARATSIALVKQQLIARGNDFINQQKLSQLKNQVIPESEIDDLFVTNPIRIERVADYRDGRLVFELSATPPPGWVMAFHNLGNYTSIMGSDPSTFVFSGNVASVPIHTENAAQAVLNHAKNYVHQANDAYRENLVQTHRKQLAQQREAVRKRIAEEERRAQVLGGLQL